MTIYLIAITGAIVATGIALLFGVLRRPLPRLNVAAQPAASIAELDAVVGRRADRPLGYRIGKRALDAGLWNLNIYEDLKGDLRVAGLTVEQVVARQLLAALAAVVSVGVLAAVMPLPGLIVLGVFVLAILAAAVAPIQAIRTLAEERRSEAAVAISQYVSLVANSVLGGSSVQRSFMFAADLGEGWIWDELRLALRQANESTQPHSEALGRLAEELNVRELSQLTRAISLSAEHGAPISATLRDQAELMRKHQERQVALADDRSTEKMTFPMMMLVVAFITYLGIGAAVAILRLTQTL